MVNALGSMLKREQSDLLISCLHTFHAPSLMDLIAARRCAVWSMAIPVCPGCHGQLRKHQEAQSPSANISPLHKPSPAAEHFLSPHHSSCCSCTSMSAVNSKTCLGCHCHLQSLLMASARYALHNAICNHVICTALKALSL